MSTLFSFCVRGKDIAGSRGRAPGQEIKRAKPSEDETLGFWTRNGSRKFACFLRATAATAVAVSYTHLTLPTILRV